MNQENDTLSKEELEENIAAQSDELEALEAIYGDDFQRMESPTDQGSAAHRLQVTEVSPRGSARQIRKALKLGHVSLT